MADEQSFKPDNSRLPQLLRFSFLLLVFSISLMQPFFYYKNLRFSSTDFIFPIVCLIFATAVFTRKITFRRHNFYRILLLYFLSMLVSATFSINPKQSFIKLLGETYLLGLAVLAFNLTQTETQFKTLIKVWLAGTTLTILVGLLTIFLFYFQRDNVLLAYTTSIYGAVPVGNYPRLTSTFISSSMFCNYLNVSLLMLFIAERLKLIRSLFFWTLLSLISICSIFTISSGLGGIALAFAFWVWIIYRNSYKFAAKLSVAVGILVAAAFFCLNFIALQKHPTAPYSFNLFGYELFPSSRLMVWTAAFETFIANFFTGNGLGENVCRVVFQNTDGTPAVLTDAHNVFLSVAAQNGIFGLISIICLIIYIVRQGFPLNIENTNQSIIFYFLLAAFICAFCYQGLTGSFEDARHLWLLIGLIFSAKMLYSNRV